MKAFRTPKYGSKNVLTDSCWEYVSLYLKRKSLAGASDALFYWEQAHNFYLASKDLPDSAKPLTSYYCILNATKALLRFNGIDDSKLMNHGISSERNGSNKTNLKEAITCIKEAGVLPELARYYGNSIYKGRYSLSDILYNIPCVHRSYCITFSKPEMFVPIAHPVFVKKDDSNESWISLTVSGKYANAKALKSIPVKFEHDIGVNNAYTLRSKDRFQWDIHKPIEERKAALGKYSEKVRKYLYYIYGERKLWYLKKEFSGDNPFAFIASPILIFCAFHWLSELVRYNPKLFSKYMRSKQNWLLHEFISNALDQFVDEIGCEITGEEIMCTGYRS